MLLSCKKNTHKVDKIKKSWLIKSGIPYVILIGNPTQDSDYIYDDSTKILQVKSPDDYANLNLKVYLGIKSIKKEFNPDGIFKIDDDVLIRNNKLTEFINNNKSNYDGDVAKNVGYWSDYHIGKCQITEKIFVPKDVKYCRGPIYYISKKSINIICESMDPKQHFYEDTLMGMHLNKNNIYPVDRSYFLTDYLDVFLKNKSIIAFHDIDNNYDILEVSINNNINNNPKLNLGLIIIYILIIIVLFLVLLLLKSMSV